MNSLTKKLNLGIGRRLPIVMQSEAAECGLACIAMIACWHGLEVDLPTLRKRFSLSLRGATLRQLTDIATSLQMDSRALRFDLNELSLLRTPCILHWELNHFLVLKRVTGSHLELHDPARGKVRVRIAEVSARITGVALEFSTTPEFVRADVMRPVSVRALMGRVTGLGRSLVQILGFALALEVFSIVTPFFMQWVVDGAILSADLDLLTTLVLGFGLLMTVQALVGLGRTWSILYMATHLNLQWVGNVFGHLLRLPNEWFEKRHLGDIVSRFGSVSIIQQTLTTNFVEAIVDGLMAILTLAMMLIYSVELSTISIFSFLLYASLRLIAYEPFKRATEESIVLNARQNTLFLESIRAVRAIKLFEAEGQRRSFWLSALVESINRGLTTQKMAIGFGLLNTLVRGVERLLVVWLGARLTISNNFSVGMLFAFIAYKESFDSRLTSLVDKFVQLRMLKLQGERLADIVLTAPETDFGSVPHTSPADYSLEFRDVSFRYADGEPWILKSVNLKVSAGELVAIVGPSGCGKSTLLKIALGLLSPNYGEVLIGGISIQAFGSQAWRRMIGAVLQDDTLLSGSIADNISFFDESENSEFIAHCAKLAAIYDDVRSMPMGFRTLVGDMGTTLSGGQKQRLLLARSLYKQPKVLLLDEATSHLDTNNESLVNSAVRSLGVTCVIVAHRAETIAMADRVVEFSAFCR